MTIDLRVVRLLTFGSYAIAALALAGCKPQNAYVPPPPPQVSVAVPVQQPVTAYLQATGNTAPYNQIDLVARVEGFLSEIKYQDGASAKTGDTLFVIEPAPYQAQLQEAQGSLALAQADLVQAEAEYYRQSTLAKQDFASQAALDQARAKRDGDKGKVATQQGSLTVAASNLSYTHVAAPFDGVVTKHLVDLGALVGSTGPTKLATLVQLDPIYVTFNVSEQDVLRVRENLKQRRLTLAEINQVPIEIGLMDEDGYPHKGTLDYAAPEVDASTGTLLVRGIFKNPDRALLPGFFVRIRVPMSLQAKTALLVPDRALGADQAGRYVLVVGKDDTVEQRTVTVGQQYGALRVIESGLQPDDHVVVEGNSHAIPGRKVAPQTVTIAADGSVSTTTAAK